MKSATQDYIDKEEAAERKPVELYHLWREDGSEHWYYTSGDVLVTYDTHDYVPATLRRTSVNYQAEIDVTSMKITTAFVETPVLEFIAVNPIEILWVSVMKLFRDQDPLEESVIFVGQIKNVSFKGAQATIDCVGFEQFLKEPVPVYRYQLTCNNSLFDANCGKLKADYKVTETVFVNDAKTKLTGALFGDKEGGYFTGGEAVFGHQSVSIVAHVGAEITLTHKMQGITDSDSVDVYPGCDGRAETCRDKYDNILNFFGFPFIPLENPAMRVTW
ncbi:MAG: phage BR0599 family protein [Deltaproteobacteria bacterium]|nr:phage BR0599 family protein [Deltaproteobacteria bacterium]